MPLPVVLRRSGEIDEICLEALKRQSLLPSKPAPIRVERFVEKEFKTAPSYEDLGPIQVFSDLSCSETKTRPVYRPPALRAETAGEVRQTASKVQALIGSLLFAKQRPRCAPMTRHPARAIATLITSSIWRQWLEQRFGARRALIGCSSYRTRVADERSLQTNVNF